MANQIRCQKDFVASRLWPLQVVGDKLRSREAIARVNAGNFVRVDCNDPEVRQVWGGPCDRAYRFEANAWVTTGIAYFCYSGLVGPYAVPRQAKWEAWALVVQVSRNYYVAGWETNFDALQFIALEEQYRREHNRTVLRQHQGCLTSQAWKELWLRYT